MILSIMALKRQGRHLICLMGLVWLLGWGIRPLVAQTNAVVGDGTPASCTEAAFNTALAAVQASGDGDISFNCGGPATIIFTSQKVIDSNLVIINGGETITLSGANSTRLFHVLAGGFELRNITLTNGFSGNGYGGAVLAEQGSSVYVINSTIQNSRTNAGFAGGAILSFATQTTIPTVSIEDSIIQGNESPFAAINTVGKLVVSNSVIQNNNGGGLGVGGPTTIINSDIRNNVVAERHGGGILTTAAADVEMVGGFIRGNEAFGGGGIMNEGRVSLTDVTVWFNESDSFGGGIYNSGDLYLDRVTFIGNFSGAVQGAKIYNASDGYVLARNSTFVGHETIFPDGNTFFNAGQLVFQNATLWGNTFAAGQATIHNASGGLLTLRNTIIGNDAVNEGTGCTGEPILTSDFSLFGDDSCRWLGGSGNIMGSRLTMGSLDFNGGPTMTKMPPANSPAIDAGQCDLDKDQRGVPRPQGAACDIGAVERRRQDSGYFVYLPLVVR